MKLEYNYESLENMVYYLCHHNGFNLLDSLVKYTNPEDFQPLNAIIETYKLEYNYKDKNFRYIKLKL